MLSDLDLKMSFEVHGKKKCPGAIRALSLDSLAHWTHWIGGLAGSVDSLDSLASEMLIGNDLIAQY
jgi:hypothetical protein